MNSVKKNENFGQNKYVEIRDSKLEILCEIIEIPLEPLKV